jgi:hypothetical protein
MAGYEFLSQDLRFLCFIFTPLTLSHRLLVWWISFRKILKILSAGLDFHKDFSVFVNLSRNIIKYFIDKRKEKKVKGIGFNRNMS